MIAVPAMFVEGGDFWPTLAIILIGLAGVFSATMMCECMRHVPGNENFRGRIEYIAIVDHFLGPRWSFVACIFLALAIIVLNMAALVIASQGLDKLLIGLFGETCGIALRSGGLLCSSATGNSSAFTEPSVLSFGYVISLSISLPMSFMNLDDNVKVQIVSLFVITGILFMWTCNLLPDYVDQQFVQTPDESKFWGTKHATIAGAVLANFPFVTTVPSWVNEKKPEISVNKLLWGSVIFCVAVYIVFGEVAGTALRHVLSPDTDFLTAISARNHGFINQVALQVFPFIAALLGVPVMVVVCRYNLMQAVIVESSAVANFIAYGIPYICCILFADRLAFVLAWGSLFFVSVCNFLIPFLCFYKHKMDAGEGIGINNVLDDAHDHFEPLITGNESKITHWALPGDQKSRSKGYFTAFLFFGILATIVGSCLANSA